MTQERSQYSLAAWGKHDGACGAKAVSTPRTASEKRGAA